MQGRTICTYYRIIRELGRGGFGVTYLAENTQIPKIPNKQYHPFCVIKQLQPPPGHLAKAKELFEREALILQTLGNHHDNLNYIPRLLAYTEENGEFFLIQDFIDGQDLSKQEINGQKLSEQQVIDLLKEILIILEFIHNNKDNKVIHRDIKPSNLMRRNDNQKIMLIDFGTVKEIKSLNNSSKTINIGTLGYKPPEQGAGHPEFCSDIYALGMIAIYALTGIEAHVIPKNNNDYVIWRDRLPNDVIYNPEFLNIIDKMVQPDHLKRYQSAKEVLTALNDLSIPFFEQFKNFILSPIGVGSSGIVLMGIIFIFWFLFIRKTLKCQFQTYQFNDVVINYHIKVCYPRYDRYFREPEIWKKQNISNALGQVAKFLPPPENNKQNFENVELTVIPNQKLTLDQYVENALKQITQNGGRANQPIDITMNHQPGKKIIYEISANGEKVKRMEIFIFKLDQVYTLTYSAEPKNFDKYLPEVDLMMNNLEILDNEKN